MPDREKVIGHLNDCMEASRADNGWVFVRKDIIADALALLKEQEVVEPIAKEDDTYECICGAIVGWDELDASGIVQTRFNFCPFCRRSVKWK